MSYRTYNLSACVGMVCVLGLTAAPVMGQVKTWSGNHSGNDFWTSNANWVGGVAPVAGDSLIFAGSTRLTPVNNFGGGTHFGNITFSSTASAFSISGNGLFLNGNIVNESSQTQTVGVFSGNGVTLNGGNRTLSALNGDLSVQSRVSTNGNILIASAAANRTLTLNGDVVGFGADPSGGLRKVGAGTLVLGNTNTYNGTTTLDEGVIEFSSTGNFQGTSGIVITATSANSTLRATADGVTIASGITQTGRGNYEVGTGHTLTLGGGISGSGDVRQIGTGTLSLTGNNTYTGATLINGGTVAINSAANLQDTSGIEFAATYQTSTLHAAVDGIVLNKTIEQTGPGNYRVGVGHTLTLSGVISGFGQLRKDGAGTVILDAANDYSGRTVVREGVLQLGPSGSITNANMDVTGGTFDMNGKNLTISNTVTIGSGSSFGTLLSSGNASTLTVGTSIAAASGLVEVNLAGNGGLSKTTAGTVTLAGNNTYTGTTTVLAGTLIVDGDIANSAVTVTGNGTLGGTGTLDVAVTFEAGSNLDLTGAILGSPSSNILTVAGDQAITFDSFAFSDIVGWDWLNADLGTYTLINGGSTVVLGGSTPTEANPFDFGNGKWGYFQQGSFQAVIVPEPSVGLLGAIGLMALACRHRRKVKRNESHA